MEHKQEEKKVFLSNRSSGILIACIVLLLVIVCSVLITALAGITLLDAAGLRVRTNPTSEISPIVTNQSSTIPTPASVPTEKIESPNIDGILAPGEWDHADNIIFEVGLASNGGGTAEGILYIYNDATNLYLAVKVVSTTLEADSVVFQFDSDNNGSLFSNGDDVLFISSPTRGGLPFLFYDGVRTNEPPCGEGNPPGWCGFEDVKAGGTNDGQGAVTNNGIFRFYEFSHPLNSGDDTHDFSLASGDIVGYRLSIRYCESNCVDTYVPSSPGKMNKIVIK